MSEAPTTFSTRRTPVRSQRRYLTLEPVGTSTTVLKTLLLFLLLLCLGFGRRKGERTRGG